MIFIVFALGYFTGGACSILLIRMYRKALGLKPDIFSGTQLIKEGK